jgi:spore maturation protein CgeB
MGAVVLVATPAAPLYGAPVQAGRAKDESGHTLDLLLVGTRGGSHVGGSLEQAARALGLRVDLIDLSAAWDGPWLLKKLNWHVRGHYPTRLRSFSRGLLETCARTRPRWVLTTGVAPVQASVLHAIHAQGSSTLNFLTDDPWNPAHRARWALASTRAYDRVYSPRRANFEDLIALGCRDVRYVPFGYDPALFHADAGSADLASDIVFVGGADADRVPWLKALTDAGLHVALYGGYWERFKSVAGDKRGLAEPAVVRRATASAKIALCLVRRANRDGHVMRSLEIPAVGACMLVEDTAEHRELFGADGECVSYFATQAQMIERARWLLANPLERERLKHAVHARITRGGHTYEHRLADMLELRPGS